MAASGQDLFLVVYLLTTFALFMPTLTQQQLFSEDSDISSSLPESSLRTLYFTQQVDHFGFHNQDTFKQRYFVADQFWNHNGGPIFFYTGHEGNMATSAKGFGFMWQNAPEFKAMLVFAEHRFYGSSIPYGPDVFKDPAKLNYLTSEQALADYAVLIRFIKDTVPGAQSSPVVAFGGSYGGMLAAWMRMKYPASVIGALASSAPIWMFSGLTPCSTYYNITTNTFRATSPQCADNIKRSWKTINTFASTAEGLAFVTDTFKLCRPLKTAADVFGFKIWLKNTWADLATVDYPYPIHSFQALPAWPVKEACSFLKTPMNDTQLITGLYQAINMYFNYTGKTNCLNVSTSPPSAIEWIPWSYQTCSEIVEPFCADANSMFEPATWNFSTYSDYCYSRNKVRPREYWIPVQFGGKDISSASNIIFSNGLLDPASAGGVLNSISNTLIAIPIPWAAHCLDLAFANPNDTEYIKAARRQEKSIIWHWLTVPPVTSVSPTHVTSIASNKDFTVLPTNHLLFALLYYLCVSI